MEIKKIENNKQKLLLTYLIVSDNFIEKFYPILQEHKNIIYPYLNNFYKTVLNWCLEYFEKYNKAPNILIQEIYEDKKQQLKKEDQELISLFLSNLSNKYVEEKRNEVYIQDLCLKYLNELSLADLNKKIEKLREEGKIEEAQNLVSVYSKLDLQTEIKQETWIFSDIKTAQESCDLENNINENEKLFKLRGELGEKLDWICREDFFSLNGVNKIGKSYYLREISLVCAEEYGLNVAIFNLEMSHPKYRRIIYQNISGEVKNKPEDFEIIKLPYFEQTENKFNIKYEEIKKYGLSSRKITSALRKEKIKSKGEIVLRSFPTNTLAFQKMSQCLDEYALQGFIVDVILIDFLDNIKELTKEHRHAINNIWTNGRRLAQEKHAAVGTVSHTNKNTNNRNIRKGDSVEDVRKEAHVTHMLGLNQSADDKEKQIMRINILHNRDGDANEKEFFISLECRAIGRVLLDTKTISNVNYNISREK